VAWAGDKGYRAPWIDDALLELDIAPVIRDDYQHLLERDKAEKVALVASMRKLLIRLNALMAEPQNA
jgi:transposase